MKKMMAIFLFAVIACAPVFAQQKDELPKATDAARTDKAQVKDSATTSADGQTGIVIISLPENQSESVEKETVAPAPKFVFKDGAFYLEIHGSATLIPVSGGGASGSW